MIKVEFNPKKYELKFSGHADQGKKGKDIVCSAISILFYTLGDSLMQYNDVMEESPIVKDDEGDGYIICKPMEEYKPNIDTIYWTVLNGIQLVADTYPKAVKLIVKK